jgi:hypothetical protein
VALFLLIGFLTSLVCGFQFPMALSRKGDAPSSAGGLYAADLFGAACGTLVTSVVLLPQGGLLWAAGGVMAIKLVSLLRTVRHETAQST